MLWRRIGNGIWKGNAMSDLVVLITKAFDFTARKHVGQRRKGADQEPYVNHVAEVARLLAEATNGQDPVLIVAGLLHDTVEDTDTTYEKLKAEFGQEVANLVLEVTDDKSLPKDVRKRLQVETVGKKSDRAKMLKLADMTSNLCAIINNPPTDWSLKRRIGYFEWAAQVAEGCRGVNGALDEAFDAAHVAGLEALVGSKSNFVDKGSN